MRHVAAVTGIRSEYDIMSPVYQAIQAHPALRLSLIVTGAHLSKQFGLTVEEIRADGLAVAEAVESLISGDNRGSRVKGAAIQMYGLAQSIERLAPDLLLAFGDREEAITTALVGSYLHLPVVHISGGDRVVGNVDDHVRHAVTKLAHIHCTTNEDSTQRILKMGEQPFRVFTTGNPGLDRMAATPVVSRQALLESFGFPQDTWQRPLLLLIQHVISSEVEAAYRQMRVTMEAIAHLQYNTVVSSPNSDAGNAELVRCLGEFAHLPFIKIFKNIPRHQFVNTMRHAACMVGNSSSGLLEAPFFKLPVVNVGNRQKARLHAENVQFVPHEQDALVAAIRRACLDDAYRAQVAECRNPYGDGHSTARILKILTDVVIDEQLLLKDITY